MGDAVMQLGPEQLEAIGNYVRSHLKEWMSDTGENTGRRSERELDLIERTIRVEESLKNVQEQLKIGFDYMERRFEQIDKRFEQVDKRFEQVDKRFEQVDKRFEQVDKRFEELREDMKTQFNRVYGFLTGLFLAVGGGFITLVVRG
jgi:septation ring formation regulator EzrA